MAKALLTQDDVNDLIVNFYKKRHDKKADNLAFAETTIKKLLDLINRGKLLPSILDSLKDESYCEEYSLLGRYYKEIKVVLSDKPIKGRTFENPIQNLYITNDWFSDSKNLDPQKSYRENNKLCFLCLQILI